MLSLSVLSASDPFPFVPFSFASGYSAFRFFLSSFFPSPPHSGFLGALLLLSLLWLSSFSPTWFPVSSFPIPRTRLTVCFLSPFPDSLPQLFLRCLPRALAFGLFPCRFAFFRPLLFRFRLLSLCLFLSSFFPFPPHSGFLGAPSPLSLPWLSPFLPT